MRAKSFPIRSSCESLDPYASLPDDGANGVSTTHCDDGDADVEIGPDTFDERNVPHKKRHCLGTIKTDRGGSVELINLDACIVCEISDKRVLHCSGIECLLSFHGECLYAELASSEHLENPYCPYCWLKILALKSKSLREKIVGAEKAVFKYLDKEMKSRDEDTTFSGDENGNQEHSMDSADIVSDQELQGKKDARSSKEEQVQVEKDFDKLRDEYMRLMDETDQPEEDKGKLEVGTDKGASDDEETVATENFQDAEDTEIAKDQTKVSTGAGKKGDVSPFLSMEESFSGKEHDQVQKNEKQRRRRRLIEFNTDSEISSKESSNERNGEDVTEQIISSTQVTSPSGKMKNQQGQPTATTKVVVAKPKTTVRDISFFEKDQRRKLFWTFEEEEMLKVVVEKFAAEAKKNMSWRKVLEMGEKVFHETRNSSDLKDKWRKMVANRTGPEMSKTAQ